MSDPMARSQQARFPLVIAVVPYAELALLVVFTVFEKRLAVFDLIRCALAGLWMLWMVTLHPTWRQRPRMMGVFLGVLMAIMIVLAAGDPWFGLFASAGYLYAFRLLPWPARLPGVAAVAVVAATAQSYGISKTTFVGLLACFILLAANVVPMCGFAWFAWRNSRQSEEREQALREVKETNRRLEATLAENAGLHEQLMARAREAGVLDERQRMAREIHDTLTQGLTGIVAQLQAAEQAGEDPAEWRRHVTAATRLARESLTEARRSVHALRPEPLETARLGEALKNIAGRWSSLHGLAVEVTTTGEARPMRPEVEVALLRTAQEALANVRW